MNLKTTVNTAIFVPLLFQILVTGVLAYFVYAAQEDALESAASEELVHRCNLVFRSWLPVQQDLFMETGHYAKSDRAEFETELAACQSAALSLHESIKSNPVYRDYDAQLLQVTQNSIAESLALYSKLQGGGFEKEEAKDLLELPEQQGWIKILRVVHDIIEAHKIAERESVLFKASRTSEINLLLIVLSLLSMLVTAYCAYRCIDSMRIWIERMKDNVDKFARRKALSPPLQGADQLARIDILFHQMNDAVGQALTRERDLIRNAADMIATIDGDTKFVTVNKFSQRMLGYQSNQLVGKAVIEFIQPEDCDRVDRNLAAAMKAEESQRFEARMIRDNQSKIDTAWSTFWSSATQNIFAVISDITERKKIERLKQDFIAMVSHDLRSPLMAVQGSVVLLRALADSMPAAADLELAKSELSLNRSIDLINDLLDFEKMHAGKMQFLQTACDLSSLLEEALLQLQPLTESRSIRVESKAPAITVLVDRLLFTQLLVNLSSNSIQRSPESGTVRIAALLLGDKLRVSFCDQGASISEIYRETLFSSTESHPESTVQLGSGLGMQVCRLIVEAHRGSIGVQNLPSEGTEFWFELPC